MNSQDVETLTKATREASADIQEPLLRLLSIQDATMRPVVARALRAIDAIMRGVPHGAALEAVGKASDIGSLVTLLQATNAPLLDDQPFARALLRGVVARDELLTAEGGVITADAVKDVLHLTSRQAVDNRRKAGRLLAVEAGRRGFLFPVWQFSANDGMLRGFEATLGELREAGLDPWMSLIFFLGALPGLGGRTPLQALRDGDTDRVRKVAASAGEQGGR
ncbi:MAG: hypothetical protein ACRDHX_01055 [Chloroflexota bacterium]